MLAFNSQQKLRDTNGIWPACGKVELVLLNYLYCTYYLLKQKHLNH